MPNYWLMKTEPSTFSIDDLEREQVSPWEGVRNYQARNILRDDMKVGDGVLIYHSSTQPLGVAGLAKVVNAGYPDPTAWDSKSPYFDPKSSPEAPTWFRIDVAFAATFPRFVTLEEIKAHQGLEGIMVAKKGQRLSIQPVSKEHFAIIKKLGMRK